MPKRGTLFRTLFHGKINRAKMPRRESHEKAWAAGFFDGEGSTHVAWVKARKDKDPLCYVQLSIGQAGPLGGKILSRFGEAISNLGKLYGPYKPMKHQTLQRWCYEVNGLEKILTALWYLWPWLSDVKRQQATLNIRKHIECRLPDKKNR